MANTYVLINSSTVGSGGATDITFSSIPATYTDLLLKISLRTTNPVIVENLQVNFNSSTTGWGSREIYGDGAAAASATETAIGRYTGLIPGSSSTTSTFSNADIYVPNYASANYKTMSVDSVSENNATTAYAVLSAVLWSNTAAVTSIIIKPTSAYSFVQYCTAYLYGIKNS